METLIKLCLKSIGYTAAGGFKKRGLVVIIINPVLLLNFLINWVRIRIFCVFLCFFDEISLFHVKFLSGTALRTAIGTTFWPRCSQHFIQHFYQALPRNWANIWKKCVFFDAFPKWKRNFISIDLFVPTTISLDIENFFKTLFLKIRRRSFEMLIFQNVRRITSISCW